MMLSALLNTKAAGKGLLWVDIEATSGEGAQFLTDVFHFHPLAVADCVSKNIHFSEIDQFENHLFIIVHGINYVAESDAVENDFKIMRGG